MKRIVLDPGHRNNALDWGASGNGLREASIAMRIAIHAADYLNAYHTGFDVRLTRKSDSQVIALDDRDDVADNWGADVFVSIHLNAANTTGYGFETFIYDKLLSTDKKTPQLQNIMHDEIYAAMSKFGTIKNRGKKQKNLAVLRETNMPAILTENLFIDNVSDAAYLKNDAFIKAVGQAHGRGIAKYLGLPTKSVQTTTQPVKNNQPDYVGSAHEAAIKKAMEKGILKGYTNGDFGPNDPLTRGQFATVLDRLGLLK